MSIFYTLMCHIRLFELQSTSSVSAENTTTRHTSNHEHHLGDVPGIRQSLRLSKLLKCTSLTLTQPADAAERPPILNSVLRGLKLVKACAGHRWCQRARASIPFRSSSHRAGWGQPQCIARHRFTNHTPWHSHGHQACALKEALSNSLPIQSRVTFTCSDSRLRLRAKMNSLPNAEVAHTKVKRRLFQPGSTLVYSRLRSFVQFKVLSCSGNPLSS